MFLGERDFSKFYIFVFDLIKIITIVFVLRMSLLMFAAGHGGLWLCALLELAFLAAIYFFAKRVSFAYKTAPLSVLNLIAYIYCFFLANAVFGTSYVGGFYLALSPIYFFVENIEKLWWRPLGSESACAAVFSLLAAALFIAALLRAKIFKHGGPK